MLKGIKKIVKEQDKKEQSEDKGYHNSIASNTIKNQVMKEEEIQDQGQNQSSIMQSILKKQNESELGMYQECYDLFIQGKGEILEEKLKMLKNKERQSFEQKQEKNQKKNFDYNINFDEEANLTEKEQLKKRNKPIMASNRISEYCLFCPDNQQLELISASNYVYLALPKIKTFRNYFHLILAPVDHQQTMIGLNQDTLTEINNYKKCLLQAFDKVGLQVIFFEQFSKQNSHIYIQCLAMSYNRAQDLPFFFKQALEDIQGSWSTHKNVIRIQKEKGGLQRQIPKQIKYFYVDFSIGYGYAHVIEDEKHWKRQFCYQVLATALGMETHQVKTTEEFNSEEIQIKKTEFTKIWKKYDWTELI